MAGFSRSVLQPLLEGAALEEGEEMDYSVENVACSILRDEDDDDDELKEPEFWGCGTLSVTTTRVLWRRTEAAPEAHADAMAAFAVQVKHVGLHVSQKAVTRDPETFASPCLYAQLLLDEFEGESNEPAELYLAPRNVKQLPELFAAFSKAAELNPDTDDDEDDDDLVMNGVLGGGGDDDEPRAALDSQAMMDRFDAMLNVGDYARRPPEDEQHVAGVVWGGHAVNLGSRPESPLSESPPALTSPLSPCECIASCAPRDGQFDDAENDCAEANDYE